MKKVLCHGCFDVIHAGHLAHFKKAKEYGEYLIVSVTNDQFVNKGPGRPFFTADRRRGMLEALRVVDEVFISNEATARGAIERFKPDFYVKGSEYRDFSKDVTGEILNEKKAIEEVGGQLVFTNEETFSSSNIINRHFQPWTDAQRDTIDRIQTIGGIEYIEKGINRLEALRVLVIGEPIIDVYRFVTPEGISSKSPSISARFTHEETYKGGSLAIGAHLEEFCKSVIIQTPSSPPPRKIRYISGSQRIFEVTHIEDQTWEKHNPEYFCDKIIELSKMSDVVILADFGHGCFEGPVLEACKELNGFVGLNVQTNSSNFGYNVYHKHKRFDYLCLDTREGRLAKHDRNSSPLDIAHQIHQDIGRPFGFTVGSNGAYLMNAEGTYYSPTFSDVVVDATGAGDAYFAITTMLSSQGVNPVLIPFIGNVFAGLKCKIIGNKSSVSKASLLKACAGILK